MALRKMRRRDFRILMSSTYKGVRVYQKRRDFYHLRHQKMFDDQDLGFFANFLGIFIFVLVIAYHFVMADPKYEGN
ncbi:hypothetical protein L6164_009901 [Bauhinia variegata]|uniref:Uncharacterized protein n=1 Tax=Bauhinia variegata TaxID=167791 RepID=A0ACB9PRU2_BAUVA|nr:hypothetical protein L6164_009901 [Bauhinia variegata]